MNNKPLSILIDFCICIKFSYLFRYHGYTIPQKEGLEDECSFLDKNNSLVCMVVAKTIH
jgi:hypothetical protein